MKYYLVLFKYADKWHIDVFTRDEPLEEGSEEAKRYTIEAASFAIENNGLKDEEHTLIQEAVLFRITSSTKSDGSGMAGFSNPLSAVDNIHI